MTLPSLLRRLQRYDLDITFQSPRLHGKRAARWTVTAYDWNRWDARSEPDTWRWRAYANSLFAALRMIARDL